MVGVLLGAGIFFMSIGVVFVSFSVFVFLMFVV